MEATCKTEATTPDDQSGEATRPQELNVDDVGGALIAPAVEDEPGTEARAEGEDRETEIEPEEETADLKVGVDPIQPSAADVAEHRVTHMPYRSWCQHCVAGRGLGEQRGRHVGRKLEIP